MTRGPARQFDRDEALEKALKLFWTQGYEATGMSELLEVMGIGRQSLYNTFGDKKSLFLEALERYFLDRLGLIRSTLGRPGSPMGNLQEVMSTMMRSTAESGFCGCLVGNSVAEFGDRDPEIRAVVSRFMDRIQEAFEEGLQKAKAAGELPPGIEAKEMAELLLTLGQGIALITKIRPSVETGESLMRTVYSLLGAPPPNPPETAETLSTA